MMCISLNARQRDTRRKVAAKHRDWYQNYLSLTMFMDDSRFNLDDDTRRVLIWRTISISGRTDLYVPRITRMWAPAVPYASAIDDFCLLMQECARSYMAVVVDNVLEAETL
ncbi:hypothetical protein TNCV_4011811 [Trichonephila clavipes]|nr:hypothetical protein TNCV_4011811 [Trichonephila clavipes]